MLVVLIFGCFVLFLFSFLYFGLLVLLFCFVLFHFALFFIFGLILGFKVQGCR